MQHNSAKIYKQHKKVVSKPMRLGVSSQGSLKGSLNLPWEIHPVNLTVRKYTKSGPSLPVPPPISLITVNDEDLRSLQSPKHRKGAKTYKQHENVVSDPTRRRVLSQNEVEGRLNPPFEKLQASRSGREYTKPGRIPPGHHPTSTIGVDNCGLRLLRSQMHCKSACIYEQEVVSESTRHEVSLPDKNTSKVNLLG